MKKLSQSRSLRKLGFNMECIEYMCCFCNKFKLYKFLKVNQIYLTSKILYCILEYNFQSTLCLIIINEYLL